MFALAAKRFAEIATLVGAVDGFDGLLQADGDEQADGDGGDVNDEVAPSMGGVFGRVDVEHGSFHYSGVKTRWRS